MAISHVNTQTDTVAVGTSVTATKPTGTASGDLLVAVFTSNSQDCTPPPGWTEIVDEVVEVFRCQIFYKVAGGSEPANYTFSVGSSAPLVLSVSAFRGIDTAAPIDISPVFESGTGHSEAYTTPSVTGGSSGRLLYLRTVRESGSTPATFTASSVTELADVGVFSGGSVSYSLGLYMATVDYNTSGSQSGLAITCSLTEEHNIVATWGIKSAGVPGSMSANMPIPTVSMSGSWAIPAVVDADIPLPSVSVTAFSGEFEGSLAAQVPITVSVVAFVEPRGALDASILPVITMGAETRHFSDSVISIEREERWLIMTQDGYRPGIRSGADLPMNIDLPLILVDFTGSGFPQPGLISVTSSAFDATVASGALASAGTASIAVTAYDAAISQLSTVSASVAANNASVKISPSADQASPSVTAHDVPLINLQEIFASVVVNDATVTSTVAPVAGIASVSIAVNDATVSYVSSVSASVTAYDVTMTGTTLASAEMVTVSVEGNSAAGAYAPAESADVTVTANQPTVTILSMIQAPAESVAVSVTAGDPIASTSVDSGVAAVAAVVDNPAGTQASAETISVTATANQPTVSSVGITQASAELVAVTVSSSGQVASVSAASDVASVSIASNNPTGNLIQAEFADLIVVETWQPTVVTIGITQALAGHVTVSFHNGGLPADPDAVAVSATANQPTVSVLSMIQAPAGHAAVTCHN